MIKIIFALCMILFCLPYKALCNEYYVGCIYKLSGKVEIYSATTKKWSPASQYVPVQEKDKIKTYKSAFCDIVMQDGSTLRLNENTEVDIKTLQLLNKKQKYQFGVKSGRILGLLGKLSTADSSIKIRTPNAVMAIRGTDFALNVSSDATNVGLFEGELAINSSTLEEGTEEDESIEKEEIEDPTKQEKIILTPDKEAVIETGKKPKVEERLSRFMEKEKQRWLQVKQYVEGIRRKLEERESYLQDCIKRQKEKMKKWENNRQERLKRLEKKDEKKNQEK